jgi:hypothetical protein
MVSLKVDWWATLPEPSALSVYFLFGVQAAVHQDGAGQAGGDPEFARERVRPHAPQCALLSAQEP